MFPGIGDPPPTKDKAMMQWMRTITEVVKKGTGQAGDASWLTWDKLEDSDEKVLYLRGRAIRG